MSSIRRKNIIWKIEKCTKQNALIVVRTAKFLSNLQKVNQLDAKIASERTNPKEVLAVETAVETAVTVGSVEITIDSAMIDQEKCTKQLVLIVEKNVKYHSNHRETSQLDAEIVFKQLETKVFS